MPQAFQGSNTPSTLHAVKAVLFDRDGTLLDLQATWAGAFYYLIRDMAKGDEAKINAIADYSGYLMESRTFDMSSRLLTGAPTDYCPVWADICGLPFDDAFMQYFTDLSLKYCDVSPTFLPGAAMALDCLKKAGIPMGIATNGTESSARRQMQNLGYEHHFSAIIGYDSGYGEKPGPGQVLAFAKMHNIDPTDIIMIGDSLHDVHAGKAAGAMTLALPTGAASLAELQAEADQVLQSLTDLPLALGLPPAKTAPQPRPVMPV